MKLILLFAALLLGGAVHAQTAPTTSPATAAPLPPPPIGTIDTNTSPLPTTQQPRQDRVRNRQTVMDGQPSPSVNTKGERRAPRTKGKKARPASTTEATDPR